MAVRVEEFPLSAWLLRFIGRAPSRPTTRSSAAWLRAWLVLALVAPALGMGGWARPVAAVPGGVVEPGFHAGFAGHGDPAKHNEPSPVRAETIDAEDSEDDVRVRAAKEPFWLAAAPDLDLVRSVTLHTFAAEHRRGVARGYRGLLNNRGPPRA